MATLIFDYDGTIHESIHIYAPAFKSAQKYLFSKNLISSKEYSDKEISSWLGFTAKEMWDNFAPFLNNKEKEHCGKIIGDEMLRFINEGKARLYPNAIPVLQYLKNQGHTLIFLSNCKIEYMNAHIRCFNLDKYFSDFYCSEQFAFKPKHKIFEQIKPKYNQDFIVIGDRFHDIEIALRHNLRSIGCDYGYGCENELELADFIINEIQSLKNHI